MRIVGSIRSLFIHSIRVPKLSLISIILPIAVVLGAASPVALASVINHRLVLIPTKAKQLVRSHGDSPAALKNPSLSQSLSNSMQKPTLPSNGSATGFDDTAPNPDKLPIPKNTKPLYFSPSSITIYKNATGVAIPGLKLGVTDKVVRASNIDAKPMNFPSTDASSAIFLTTDSFTVRPNWDMTVSSSYASIGKTDIHVSAISRDDTVLYVGTLHVTVLPLPTFSIVNPPGSLYANMHFADTEFTVTNYFTISYSPGFSDADKPSLTIENGSNFTFTTPSYTNTTIHGLVQLPQVTGQYATSMVFENQFQKLTVPFTIILDY